MEAFLLLKRVMMRVSVHKRKDFLLQSPFTVTVFSWLVGDEQLFYIIFGQNIAM
jgi:hypothetical protein